MTRYFKISLLAVLLILSCSVTRFWPHFHGQDPKVLEFVRDYKDLAHDRGIEFGRDPTIGFEVIDTAERIGGCYRNFGFREIVLDRRNWEKATVITRRMTIYHELTHCYCGRGHDFAKGRYSHEEESGAGYLEDGCPYSLMAPRIVTDDCAQNHFSEYTKEMFDRCKPYK